MDNYTQIQNWLLAKLYRAENLTSREMKVLLYIIRKLNGFHKASDKIPYSQMVEATGIDKRNVIKVVQSLEEKGWISVKRKNKCTNIYRLKGGVRTDTSRGVRNDTIEVSKATPSKENQKSVTSGTHSFVECDPREKEITIAELEEGLGDEYE